MAVKIILKKNVKGNERMVYDELDMLQRLKHDNIVKFKDWFESRVSNILRLATVVVMVNVRVRETKLTNG